MRVKAERVIKVIQRVLFEFGGLSRLCGRSARVILGPQGTRRINWPRPDSTESPPSSPRPLILPHHHRHRHHRHHHRHHHPPHHRYHGHPHRHHHKDTINCPQNKGRFHGKSPSNCDSLNLFFLNAKNVDLSNIQSDFLSKTFLK